LGRNAETGALLAQRTAFPFTAEWMADVTGDPRLYGFHGTLKAPMALQHGASEADLLAALGAFAASRRPFVVPSVKLACLSGFMGPRSAEPNADLQDLADSCVIEFDAFRRPAGEAELARRRAAGLSPRQEALLQRWGYPYVLEEWRFHLTLTRRLANEVERLSVMELLGQRFADYLDRPLPVMDVCLFRQPAPGRPFTVLARFAPRFHFGKILPVVGSAGERPPLNLPRLDAFRALRERWDPTGAFLNGYATRLIVGPRTSGG